MRILRVFILLMVLHPFHPVSATLLESVDDAGSSSTPSSEMTPGSWNPTCLSEHMGHMYIFMLFMLAIRQIWICSLVKLFVAIRPRLKTDRFHPSPKMENLRKIGLFVLIGLIAKITPDCEEKSILEQAGPLPPPSRLFCEFLTQFNEFVLSFRVLPLGLILFGMGQLIFLFYKNLRRWRTTRFLLLQFLFLCFTLGTLNNYFSRINNQQLINCMISGSKKDAFWDVCPIKSIWESLCVVFSMVKFW